MGFTFKRNNAQREPIHNSLPHRPSQSVRLLPCVDLSHHFQRLQIHDHDLVAPADSDVGAGAIGSDQDACGAASKVQALRLSASRSVHHHQTAVCRRRSQAGSAAYEIQVLRTEVEHLKAVNRSLREKCEELTNAAAVGFSPRLAIAVTKLREENRQLHAALEQWQKLGRPKRPLFFVDGDHAYESVREELTQIFSTVPDASALAHDTFFQSAESNYNVGPARAWQYAPNATDCRASATVYRLPW